MSVASAPGTPRVPRAAAPSSAAAAVVQGGLWGFGLAVVALLLLAPPLALAALVTMPPTVLLQVGLWPRLLHAAERGACAAATRLALTYALPIVGWTLLWSGCEYGSTWPDALGFLLAVNAPAMLLQIDLLARWRARR